MIRLDARRVRLTVGFTAVLLLLLAGAPVPSALAACPEEGPPGATSDPPRAPQIAPPPPDLDWPIVSEVTSVTNDPVSGRLITSTVTVRENPLPRPHRPDVATGTGASDPAQLPIGPQLALAACSFQTNTSVQIDTGMGVPNVFAQHYKVYSDRYINGPVYAYWNWRVDVWWTRTSSAYDLSGQYIDWLFNSFNCSSVVDHRTSTNTGWLPQWSGNQTITYANYDAYPWPVLWSDICGACGSMRISQQTTVTEFGSYAGTLNNTYIYPKF